MKGEEAWAEAASDHKMTSVFSVTTPVLTWGSPGTFQTQPGGQWQPAICWGGVGGAQESGTHIQGTSGGGCYSNHLCSEQPWLGQHTLPVLYENVFSNNLSPGPKIVHIDNREQITEIMQKLRVFFCAFKIDHISCLWRFCCVVVCYVISSSSVWNFFLVVIMNC